MQRNKPTILKGVIAAVTVIIIAILAIVLVNHNSNNDDNNTTTTVTSTAAKPAAEWVVKKLDIISKKVPSNFFGTSSSKLTQFTNGDYSFLPAEIRNSVGYTDDTFDSSRTIARSTMEASTYSALIMASQTYDIVKTRIKATPTIKTDMIYVIGDRVYIPIEALDDSPADLVLVVHKNGANWEFDGTATGVLMATKVRYTAASTSDSSDSKSGNNSSSSK